MRFDSLVNALLTVGVPVSHYAAHKQPDKYIVWAEDGQGASLFADNKMRDQVIQGTADYFTRVEYDPIAKEIQRALNDAGISWSMNSIQYEEDTRYIHYEWVWELQNGEIYR
jgi:hypothetical protein